MLKFVGKSLHIMGREYSLAPIHISSFEQNWTFKSFNKSILFFDDFPFKEVKNLTLS